MAMNKKEREELETVHYELRLARALRWTEPRQEPDVLPPTEWDVLTTGYLYNTYRATVIEACSSQGAHSQGRIDKTDSQGRRALYSTKVLALKALRAELEREYAKVLAGIDRLIASEA